MEKMSKDLKKIKNKLDNAFSKLFNYDIVDEVLVELDLWDLYSKWVEKEDDEDPFYSYNQFISALETIDTSKKPKSKPKLIEEDNEEGENDGNEKHIRDIIGF
jgi:hypothetical protein